VVQPTCKKKGNDIIEWTPADHHDCVCLDQTLKISNILNFLLQGKVSSGCKMPCGMTAQNIDIHDIYNNY